MNGAKTIISKDNDLLVLRKPFGIDIVKPSHFVARYPRAKAGVPFKR